MFSSRFYLLLYFYMACVKYCNVSPIYYDRAKLKFSYKTRGLVKVYITYCLFLLWGVAFSYKTYLFRKVRDLDNFNLCLATGLLSIIALIALSVLNVVYSDCVSLMNAIFQFVELICGKNLWKLFAWINLLIKYSSICTCFRQIHVKVRPEQEHIQSSMWNTACSIRGSCSIRIFSINAFTASWPLRTFLSWIVNSSG